jgi:hypothetical protein
MLFEESTYRQEDDIKRDIKMICSEDDRCIKSKIGFSLQTENKFQRHTKI